MSTENYATCCETKKLDEKIVYHSEDTKLTWTGENLGSCKNAKLYGDRKSLQYRIKASDNKKICPKDVNITFQSVKDHVTTFKDGFKCCRTKPSEQLFLARNPDTGKYNSIYHFETYFTTTIVDIESFWTAN